MNDLRGQMLLLAGGFAYFAVADVCFRLMRRLRRPQTPLGPGGQRATRIWAGRIEDADP